MLPKIWGAVPEIGERSPESSDDCFYTTYSIPNALFLHHVFFPPFIIPGTVYQDHFFFVKSFLSLLLLYCFSLFVFTPSVYQVSCTAITAVRLLLSKSVLEVAHIVFVSMSLLKLFYLVLRMFVAFDLFTRVHIYLVGECVSEANVQGRVDVWQANEASSTVHDRRTNGGAALGYIYVVRGRRTHEPLSACIT